MLVSCDSSENKEIKTKSGKIIQKPSIDIIEYNGHEYIIYSHGWGRCATGGITHNPDCPCGKGK
jgi:hypothetical protein